MRSQSHKWINALTQLGTTRNKQRLKAKAKTFRRLLNCELLEERRLLAAGQFLRVPLVNDLDASDDIKIDARFSGDAGGVNGFLTFSSGDLHVEDETFADLLPVPFSQGVSVGDGSASIIAEDIYATVGIPVSERTTEPFSINRVGDIREPTSGLSLSASGTTSPSLPPHTADGGGYAEAAVQMDSMARFEYEDLTDDSADIFSGLVDFVFVDGGNIGSGEVARVNGWYNFEELTIRVLRNDEALVDLILNVNNVGRNTSDPQVQRFVTLQGSIIGYPDFQNTQLSGGRLRLPFQFQIEDGDTVEYQTTINRDGAPFLSRNVFANVERDGSVNVNTKTEVSVYGGVEEGNTCAEGGYQFSETENNDTSASALVRPRVPVGTGGGQHQIVDVMGTLSSVSDDDFYAMDLQKGDVFGAALCGQSLPNTSGSKISLWRDGNGIPGLQSDDELIGSSQDVSHIYPDASPLPGGLASLSYVIDTTDVYFIKVESEGTGPYKLQVQAHRPVLESQPAGVNQVLFLDFDGAEVDLEKFGASGTATLSAFDQWFPNWNLLVTAEQMIDFIVAKVREKLDTYVSANGLNGLNYEIDILSSNDSVDPFGNQHVSRVVVGGSVPEFGDISTIGIAESIDVGNFKTDETAVVLLDRLSGPASDPFSLNHFTASGGFSQVQLVVEGIANVIVHEAGHFFSNFHTDGFNAASDLMDEGPGGLDNLLGISSGTVWTGQSVNLGEDIYSNREGFSGNENTLTSISHSLVNGKGTGAKLLVVTTADDELDPADTVPASFNPDDLSLREALALAQAIAGPNKIEFDQDVVNTGEIVLGGSGLVIDSEVEILGPGSTLLTIDANGTARVFDVVAGATTFTVRDLRLTGATGAAISETSYSSHAIVVDGAVISGNGGGILATYNGNVTVIESEIANNTGTGIGTAYGVGLLVQDSTIAENIRGISLGYASGTIVNSTISSNTSPYTTAGLDVAFGSVTLRHSTVTNNRADSGNTGGGSTAIGGLKANAAGTITLHDSIVAENYAGANNANQVPANFGETVGYYTGQFATSSSYNLIGADPNNYLGDVTGPGNIPGVVDAGLDELNYYGGPTRTHASMLGSQAINGGNPNHIAGVGVPDYDQRGPGFDRVVDGRIDIGAFESQFVTGPGALMAAASSIGSPYSASIAYSYSFSTIYGDQRTLEGNRKIALEAIDPTALGDNSRASQERYLLESRCASDLDEAFAADPTTDILIHRSKRTIRGEFGLNRTDLAAFELAADEYFGGV
jgi:hypothetical protein